MIDREQLVGELQLITGDQVPEQIAFLIFGAITTTTRAFDKVGVKIDPIGNRVFISIELRWWAKYKRLGLLRKLWLAKAERRVSDYIPAGWRPVVYYKSVSH